jgi:hypothetical protein
MAIEITKAHERNVTSQCGEDGVIEFIFKTLNVDKGTAVEFGAWDGVHLSNSVALRDRGWTTVLIEADPQRYAALKTSFENHKRVVPICRMVMPEGANSLDNILKEHGIAEIDFLSIDIDSDDARILEKLVLRPKLVCIEFNPTYPPPLDIVNTEGRRKGNSLSAIDRIARSKDYGLVYATAWNAFLVDNKLKHPFSAKRPDEVYDWSQARFVISDFDGDNAIVDGFGQRKKAKNRWDGIEAAVPMSFSDMLTGGGWMKASVRRTWAPFKRLLQASWRVLRFRG